MLSNKSHHQNQTEASLPKHESSIEVIFNLCISYMFVYTHTYKCPTSPTPWNVYDIPILFTNIDLELLNLRAIHTFLWKQKTLFQRQTLFYKHNTRRTECELKGYWEKSEILGTDIKSSTWLPRPSGSLSNRELLQQFQTQHRPV